MLRRPISEILSWPAADVLAWKSVFDVFGPLDWRRDDWACAHQLAGQFGKKGDLLRDFLVFPAPDLPKTESERNIDALKETLEEMRAIPGAEGFEEVRALIRKEQREAF